MKAWILASLLAMTVFAGCFGSSDGDGKSDAGTLRPGPSNFRHAMPEDPMPEGPGHDHTAPAQHKFLWNYEFGSRDPLLQNAANVAGVHALDTQAGYLFGAVYGSHSASVDGGLVIWDLADPAVPREVGRWTIPGSVGGDRSMEATPDGDFAVIATEAVDCAGHVNPAGVINTYLIDTRNKARPVVADVLAQDREVPPGTRFPPATNLGDHSVAVHRMGEKDYAFVAGKIYAIERGETTPSFVYQSTVPVGHDMYVRDTPWNTTWALVANGDGGMVIYDVTDPMAPFRLAEWDLEDRAAGPKYYFHTADVSFQPDGQILVVLTSEDFADDHVSPLWIIDGNPLRGITSDPGEPIPLEMMGTWSNPGQHNAYTSLSFSLHNPRFHDGGILTVSSYHGGMWQLDVRHPEFWVDPAPIAYAAYAEGEQTMVADPVEDVIQERLCQLTIELDAPSYWDVEVGPNGHLYLADGFMGLYAFKPAASHPVFGANRTVEYPGTAGTL